MASRVLGRFGAGREHRNLARTIRERAEPDVDAGGSHMVHFDRDDTRRQTLAAAPEAIDKLATMIVMEQ